MGALAGEWVWKAYAVKLLFGVVFVVLSGDVSIGWFGPFRIAIGWAALWCYFPVIILKGVGRPISLWDIRWPIILDVILYCVVLLNQEGAAEFLVYVLITMFASLPLYLYAINLFLRPLSSKADGRRAVWKTGLYILFMPWCVYCMVGFMVFF